MLLIGQKNNLEIIDSWTDLPSFLIIQGDTHAGKEYMTLYLCEKFNLRFVKMKNGINDVREMITYITPYSNTLYFFEDFDKASIQAKNSLLKITEETVPGNYIVISGHSQIKTLESRAKKIIMEPYTYEDMVNYCYGGHFEPKNYEKLYKCGINTPSKVVIYETVPDLEDLINFSMDVFDKITYITPTLLFKIVYNFENRYDNDKVDKCMLFLEILINLISDKIHNNYRYSYRGILQIITKYKNELQLEYTLKRRMLLFKMFYEIQKL